jgi:hypothetical protein
MARVRVLRAQLYASVEPRAIAVRSKRWMKTARNRADVTATLVLAQTNVLSGDAFR